MVQYTTPVTTAFEVQRTTIEQSQRALKQSVEFQKQLNDAVIGSLDTQQSAQQRGVELSRTAFNSYLDTLETTIPGIAPTVDEIRSAIDEQYEFLLENHAEVFDNAELELAEGAEAYDDLSGDLLSSVDEQIDLLVEAHEELESQSVEAVEKWSEQLDDIQQQVEEVQEQAAEVVEG